MDPWELVADPLGSAEHTLGTTALDCVTVARIRYMKHMLIIGNVAVKGLVKRTKLYNRLPQNPDNSR